MSPRYQQQQQRSRKRKQKIQHVWVNVSNGGGGGVFTSSGNLLQQQWHQRRNTGLRNHHQRQRSRHGTMNKRRVWGIRDNNGGGRGLKTGPSNLRQGQMRWMRKMSSKTTTTITEASVEDRQRVQGIGDNDRGGSGSTTAPVDWQQQRSVDFSS